jgi:hypothetical protein
VIIIVMFTNSNQAKKCNNYYTCEEYVNDNGKKTWFHTEKNDVPFKSGDFDNFKFTFSGTGASARKNIFKNKFPNRYNNKIFPITKPIFKQNCSSHYPNCETNCESDKEKCEFVDDIEEEIRAFKHNLKCREFKISQQTKNIEEKSDQNYVDNFSRLDIKYTDDKKCKVLLVINNGIDCTNNDDHNYLILNDDRNKMNWLVKKCRKNYPKMKIIIKINYDDTMKNFYDFVFDCIKSMSKDVDTNRFNLENYICENYFVENIADRIRSNY